MGDGLYEDGDAPRRGPAFISNRRCRSVISNRLTEFFEFHEIGKGTRFLGAVEEFETDKMVERRHAVLPSNFFPFSVISSRVGNRDFVDPALLSGKFEGDFWLESKSFRFEVDPIQDFLPEDFIAGFHISEIEVGQHVGKGR